MQGAGQRSQGDFDLSHATQFRGERGNPEFHTPHVIDDGGVKPGKGRWLGCRPLFEIAAVLFFPLDHDPQIDWWVGC